KPPHPGRMIGLRRPGHMREGGLGPADDDGRKQHKHEQRAAHRAYIGGGSPFSSEAPSFEGAERGGLTFQAWTRKPRRSSLSSSRLAAAAGRSAAATSLSGSYGCRLSSTAARRSPVAASSASTRRASSRRSTGSSTLQPARSSRASAAGPPGSKAASRPS